MSCVLQTSELKESYTGENVAVAFLNVTEEWSIQDKLSASHSYKARTALELKQALLGLPKHKLTQMVSTRWNSTLYI